MSRGARGLVRTLTMLLGVSFAIAWPARAPAQVTPGPLAAPHAALEGTTQCLQCHGPGGARTGMDEKCLACHKEVAWTRSAKRGYHATVAARNCASCHPDHGGRDFALIAWPDGSAEKFDHGRTGFALQGKHTQLTCAKCHTAALQKSPAAAMIRKKDRSRSWLGLQPACADCHADVHRGQLGHECRSCHAQDAWKPAPGFDHARARFPLTGAHVKVECAKCHAAPQAAKGADANGQPLPQWKPLPFADCASCHRDPHAGRFKDACAKCHTTAEWKVINKAGFNHDVTRYPLRGQHALVACEKCHDARRPGSQKPKFATCLDCHRDAHAGTATLAGKAADCASCHAVGGWRPSTYTAAMHAASAYPLEGAHARAACEGCHTAADTTAANTAAFGRSLVVLRPKRSACVDCHGDPHGGRFRPGGVRAKTADCRACHGPGAWRPSSYDSREHDTATFRLQGAHLAVPCTACHSELKAPPATKTLVAQAVSMRALRFEISRQACADCHRNPHGEQFAKRKDRGACEGCHDQNAYIPASRFEHDRDSQFRLEGAHRRTPCKSCHEPQAGPDGRPVTVYRPLATRCEACHLAGVRDSLPAPQKSSLVPSHPAGRGTVSRSTTEADRGNSR